MSQLVRLRGKHIAQTAHCALEGTSRRSVFVASNQPVGFRRLPKMIANQVGLAFVELEHVLWSYGQVPEQLVVQEVLLLPGPEILSVVRQSWKPRRKNFAAFGRNTCQFGFSFSGCNLMYSL